MPNAEVFAETEVELADGTIEALKINRGGTVLLPKGTQPIVPIDKCIRLLKGKQWYDDEADFQFWHPRMGSANIQRLCGIPTFDPEYTQVLIDELETYNTTRSESKFYMFLAQALRI